MDVKNQYRIEDIVWVKINHTIWWPGKVVNMDLFKDTLLKRVKNKPLLIVKYFDYTFKLIRNWSKVKPYNCEAKEKLIQEGMKFFLASNPNVPEKMLRFPEHVLRAEHLSGGDSDDLMMIMFNKGKNCVKLYTAYTTHIRIQNESNASNMQFPYIDPDVFLECCHKCQNCCMALRKYQLCPEHTTLRNDIINSVQMLRTLSRCKFYGRNEELYCGYCDYSVSYKEYRAMSAHLLYHEEKIQKASYRDSLYIERKYFETKHRKHEDVFC